jgi:hypothetical protein
VNSNGVFTLPVTSELLSDGTHIFETTAQLSGELEIRSEPRGIEYGKFGPWVRITSHTLRDFVTVRPYIKGEAGYALEPVDPTDKEAVARYMREREAHRVERVEVSLNNGRSFEPAQGREQWRYRLETQNFPDGDIRPIVKAVFADGSAAFDKTIVTIDDTPPEVTLLSPRREGSTRTSPCPEPRMTRTASRRCSPRSARATRRTTSFPHSSRASTSTAMPSG